MHTRTKFTTKQQNQNLMIQKSPLTYHWNLKPKSTNKKLNNSKKVNLRLLEPKFTTEMQKPKSIDPDGVPLFKYSGTNFFSQNTKTEI